MFGIVREEVRATFCCRFNLTNCVIPDVFTSKISTLNLVGVVPVVAGYAASSLQTCNLYWSGLCVKYSLQNFNLIVYGAQNLFVGFRMSAYEQIRNRLSSNGKVMQEAKEFSKRVSM